MRKKDHFMSSDTISISSDSDEDDVPLKVIKVKNSGFPEDQNSYDSLCKHSLEACEFCDRISNNRYSSLIHNVRHIIIPLLNQTVLQCPSCLHSFTSNRDLRLHTLKKHPEDGVELEPLVNDSHSTWRTSHHSNSVTQVEGRRTLKQCLANSYTTEKTNVICNGTKKNETKVEPIKNRLIFEDDDLIFLDCNSDQLLIDLTTVCKVNLETFDTPWLDGVNEEFSDKSVHYDDLVKPGVYRCKKCGKSFPIRYDAIVHESSHIKFKNSQVSLCVICNKYLIGGRNDLRHHYLTFHQGFTERSLDAEYISKIFIEEEKKAFDSKLITLCNLCFSFCKNKTSMNYECIKTKSKMGKRYVCEKCGQLFFEINVVKRSLQRRALYGTHSQKKRKKTNEDRLKTITNRFKKMKH